jgi:hypothetical protein
MTPDTDDFANLLKLLPREATGAENLLQQAIASDAPFVPHGSQEQLTHAADRAQTALTNEVQSIADGDQISLTDIKAVWFLSTGLVADKAALALLYPDGPAPSPDGDPTITIGPLSYTFLPDVSWHQIADVGGTFAGVVIAAAGFSTGNLALGVAGGLLAFSAAQDLIHGGGSNTDITVNGQSPFTPENTALPPFAFEGGTEPEPDGDSDDASFASSALAGADMTIPGYANFLQSQFQLA